MRKVMMMSVCSVLLASGLAWGQAPSVKSMPPSVVKTVPQSGDTPILHKLLKAVEANDYAGFIADGTDEFKAGMTTEMFEGVSALLASRMMKGYTTSCLELKQGGYQVYLGKLAFKDGGDDTLAKMILKDGKVAGFWLQ